LHGTLAGQAACPVTSALCSAAHRHYERKRAPMAAQYPHHRPHFHISPPRGYLNDPNGPIELADVFHLYFQSRSLPDLAAPVEWGHATTADLVHWSLHRPAMAPLPGGLDSDGCWSGNSVVEGDRVRAFYSGHVGGRRLEHILTAVSNRDGGDFGTPTRLLDDPSPEEGVRMLRDPFVWTDDAGWHMVVGSATEDRVAAIRHYRSADGSEWEYAGHIAELQRVTVDGVDTGEGWECPQIMRVEGREVAIVCSWSFGDGPAPVLAFPLDEDPQPLPVDDGHDFYAPSVLRDSSYGPLLFGWIMEGRDPGWWREEGWSGAISLPRRTWLDRSPSGAVRLGTEPHPALLGLREGDARDARDAEVGTRFEIVVPSATAGRIRLSFGSHEWLDIELDPQADAVTIDTDHASTDARARGGRVTAADAFDASSSRPALRVFVDGSVIEAFTSRGRSLTTRAYPLNGDDWHVEAPEGSTLWRMAEAVHTADQ